MKHLASSDECLPSPPYPVSVDGAPDSSSARSSSAHSVGNAASPWYAPPEAASRPVEACRSPFVHRLSPDEIARQQQQVHKPRVLLSVLNTAPQMLAVINPQRQIVFCNDACVKAAGATATSGVLGLRPGELLHCIHALRASGGCGTTAACGCCGLAQALARGQTGLPATAQCVIECECPESHYCLEFAVRVTPLPEIAPGWQCYALTDISHEKRREALERTFFHDILNRVASVEGLALMLEMGDLDLGEHADLYRILTTASRTVADEIRAHRSLLAAERGDLVVACESCDANRLLGDVVECYQTLTMGTGIEVHHLSRSERVTLHTDPVLLGRVLTNLLTNAIEASGPGDSVTVNVSRHHQNVRFSVHNTKALSASAQANIFRRSYSTKGPGRGLGTYSVKLFAESYLRGRVWFESDSASGTTFYVELPPTLTAVTQ